MVINNAMEPFTITGMLTKDQCTDIIRQLPDETNRLSNTSLNLTPGKWTDAEWTKINKQFNTHRIRLEQHQAAHVSSLIKPVSIEAETYTISENDFFYVNYYNKGEYCTEHRDPTKYTICIALNDEFEGGEFFVNNKPVKLNTGDGVIFPGNTTHKLSEIIFSTRWSLCIWVF